ncbi:hypothetical protein CsatA_026235 [Cannabis sativa]
MGLILLFGWKITLLEKISIVMLFSKTNGIAFHFSFGGIIIPFHYFGISTNYLSSTPAMAQAQQTLTLAK